MNLNSPLLEIKNLQVSINENEILKKLKFNCK
jgi:Fe-S cluster assembly ATPase SufC